ncbi:MAG: glycosyltransferase family 2 protein [Haloarculaceae archaeon]
MAEEESAGSGASARTEPSAFAVGFVARPDTEDAAIRETVRARSLGYESLVAVDERCCPETETLLEAAGATVLPATGTASEVTGTGTETGIGTGTETGIETETDAASLREAVVAHARAGGFDGLLFQEECRRVDYGRVADALDGGEFVVPAPIVGESAAPSILVGVPAYDEADAIADVVAAAMRHADAVVVVDDGSTDDTADRARQAGAEVVEHARNRGYGAALQTLFETAAERDVDHLVVLDGDGQHDPSDVPELVAHQRETGAEVVVGSRFVEGASTDATPLRRAGLWTINGLTNLSLGIVRARSRVHDTQSGFRSYDRRAIADLAAESRIDHRMSASVDILYHATRNDYAIEEVPTTVTYDVADASTHHPVTHGYTLLKNIVRTIETRRPLTAVGAPGVLSTGVGIGFAYWTVLNYVHSGSFPYGLAITATFFTLAGVFGVFTAIMLHALNVHLD